MVGIVYELVLDEMDEETLRILEKLLRENKKDRKSEARLEKVRKRGRKRS